MGRTVDRLGTRGTKEHQAKATDPPTPAPHPPLPLIHLPPPPEIPAPLRKLRIVLFITTHFTVSHQAFLKKCWPHAIRNSALLMWVETVIIYTTKDPTPDILDVFKGKKVMVKLFRNPGYQWGAMMA